MSSSLPMKYTKEQLVEMYHSDPEGFMRLYRQVYEILPALSRTNINWFMQYVMKWEGTDKAITQTPVHVALQKHIDENQMSLIWGAVGIGKAQPLTAKVLTPTGWTTIGKLSVGDLVVDPDGGFGRVEALTPIETKTVYEVKTADGRTAQSSDDHLWPVVTERDAIAGRDRITNVSTLELRERILAGKKPSSLLAPVPHTLTAPVEPDHNAWLVGLIHSPAFNPWTLTMVLQPHVADKLKTVVACRASRGDKAHITFAGPAADYVKSIVFEYKGVLTGAGQRTLPDLDRWHPYARSQFLSGYLDGCDADHGRADRARKGAGVRAIYRIPNVPHLRQTLVAAARSLGWSASDHSVQHHPYTALVSVRPTRTHTITNITLPDRLFTSRACLYTSVRRVGTAKVRCISVSTKRNLYITDNYMVTHNCVTEKSVLITSQWQPVHADELYERYKAGARGVHILDYDPRTLSRRFVEVTAIADNGYVPCTRLETTRGNYTCVSNNHPVWAASAVGQHPTFEEAEYVGRKRLVGTVSVAAPPSTQTERNREAEDLGLVVGLTHRMSKPKGFTYVAKDQHIMAMVLAAAPGKRTMAALRERVGLPERGVHAQLTSSRAVWAGAATWLESHGFEVTNVVRDQGRRGRLCTARWSYPWRMVVPPSITSTGRALHYARGLFAALYRDDKPLREGLLGITGGARLAKSLLWALRIGGVTARLTFCEKEACHALLLETTKGREFLESVRTTFPGLAEALRQAMADFGKYKGRRGRSTWRANKDMTSFSYDTVTNARAVRRARRTLAIETDSDHTFVCDGFFTHNTQQVSVGRSLFEIGKDVNIRILIFFSSMTATAKDVVRHIKHYIEDSVEYKKVFPHVVPGAKWTETEILVKREYQSVTPTVRIAGTGSTIDGSRYDLIIGDDFISQQNALTEGEREATYKWVVSVPLSRMSRACRVILVGNAWHREDAMHRLEALKDSAWKVLRIPARDPVTKLTLLPYIWPQKDLDLRVASIPPTEVRRQFDVVPWSLETTRFQPQWIADAFKRGVNIHTEGGVPVHFRTSYNLEEEQARVLKMRSAGKLLPYPLDVVAALDVGFGLTERSDYSAFTIAVPHDDGSLLVLYYKKAHLSELEKLEEVRRAHVRYGATIFCEAVFTQRWYYEHLKDQLPDAVILPWETKGDGTIGNKWHAIYGVSSLEIVFNRGKIILPCVRIGEHAEDVEVHPDLNDLADGLINYVPDSAIHTHDGVMSLWIAEQGSRFRGGGQYLVGLLGKEGVETDPAWSTYVNPDEETETVVYDRGIDPSSLWGSMSEHLRAMGIPKQRTKRRWTDESPEDVAPENTSVRDY